MLHTSSDTLISDFCFFSWTDSYAMEGHFMDTFFRDEVKKLCILSGFTRKGQAFFRLIGDGVLQVIKCSFERRLRGDIIYIGLFSMYDDLEPQWFTASGCIPRYSIANCYYQNNMPLVFAVPPQTQLDMLSCHVLPWLDSVDTQKKLIRAISKLDPRWNDRLKLAPYLACGQHNHAKKVIREILSQQDFAGTDRYQYVEDSNGLLSLKNEQEDTDLRMLLEIISHEDHDKIQAYLADNYTRNMTHAKFCTKNSGNFR